jgi:hypothetical protein
MTTLGKWLPLSQGDTLTEDWHCAARLGAGTLPTSACGACVHDTYIIGSWTAAPTPSRQHTTLNLCLPEVCIGSC